MKTKTYWILYGATAGVLTLGWFVSGSGPLSEAPVNAPEMVERGGASPSAAAVVDWAAPLPEMTLAETARPQRGDQAGLPSNRPERAAAAFSGRMTAADLASIGATRSGGTAAPAAIPAPSAPRPSAGGWGASETPVANGGWGVASGPPAAAVPAPGGPS